MKLFKFELTIDLSDPAQTSAFYELLNVLGRSEEPIENSDAMGESEVNTAVLPTKPKRKRRTKAEMEAARLAEGQKSKEEPAAAEPAAAEPAAAEPAAAEPAAEEPAAAEPAAEEPVTIDALRKSLIAKIQKGGDPIRAKALEEMKKHGATNLSTLPKDKYSQFNDFLQSI